MTWAARNPKKIYDYLTGNFAWINKNLSFGEDLYGIKLEEEYPDNRSSW